MNCIIIGIAGGTGSGKSTFTRRLKEEFKENVAKLWKKEPTYDTIHDNKTNHKEKNNGIF